MGVSIQQYRAAIGLHQNRDITPNNSDNTSSFSSSIFSDFYHNQSSVDDIALNSPVKGSWKLHTAALLVITTLSIISTCTPHACAKTLLIRAGVEVNPGPSVDTASRMRGREKNPCGTLRKRTRHGPWIQKL